MRVISRRRLRDFSEEEPEAKAGLDSWFYEAKQAQWRMPSDIKAKYKSASILKNNRVVFNVAGNKYRLVVRIDYEALLVFIRYIGTHADYDNIEAMEV